MFQALSYLVAEGRGPGTPMLVFFFFNQWKVWDSIHCPNQLKPVFFPSQAPLWLWCCVWGPASLRVQLEAKGRNPEAN